jgi:hypothetical protein
MKTNSIIALILSISLFGLFGCADKYEVDYEAPVKIEFAGVDQNNRVSLTKGIAEYTATVKVQGEIMSFEIYQADSKTGMQGSLIEETAQSFADGTTNYETTYKFTSLKENACITVVVLGTDGHTYQRNLLVEITPSVLFSDPDYGKDGEIVETASAYYGCYYATWLLGRTYMAADAMKSGNIMANPRQSTIREVDFSLGDVILSPGSEAVPALVSPAKRSEYGLMTINGLQHTLFAETSLSQAEFNAISQVDATPIENLADPTSEVLAIQADKVYLFKTANGKKGLICIQKITAKTGTIEVSPDNWVENTKYSWVQLLTKTVAK